MLFDGCANSHRRFRDFGNGVLDKRHRFHDSAGRSLNLSNFTTNLVRGFCGLIGQRFDFLGDDGEPFAGLPGACAFNGGVQRQQIGLFSDLLDQGDNAADL